MPHVFVETNWLFAYAAPAHHQVPAAAELLERARAGEVMLHIPNICIGEARQAILRKCQPRNEANAIRRFLSWAEPTKRVSNADAAITRMVLDKFQRSIMQDLDNLDDTFRSLASFPHVEIYGLNDAMLNRATELSLSGIHASPFDHAVLASVLVRASALWDAGQRLISFCETDADLRPWDSYGNPRPPLRKAFDQAHVWVYGDFTLTDPVRREGLE